ncbi:MAG: hypothetical protein HRT89_01560 [Lentisphaeria bacterium]|nr:hypothetical protein [Lentisphaeria bacterium]NQZ66733.1 hypothetical protein [Lentisphaeria bacterium]
MIEFLVALVVICVGLSLISIRILMVPGGQFAGTCSSNNPLMRKDDGSCSICGQKPGGSCQDETPDTELVEKETT